MKFTYAMIGGAALLLAAACQKAAEYRPQFKTNPALRALSYQMRKTTAQRAASQMLPVDTIYIDSDLARPSIQLDSSDNSFWPTDIFVDSSDKICVVYAAEQPTPQGDYQTQSSLLSNQPAKINARAPLGIVKIIVRNASPQPRAAYGDVAAVMGKEIIYRICQNQRDFYTRIYRRILDCVEGAMEAEDLVDTAPEKAQDICNSILADIQHTAKVISDFAARKEAEPYHFELLELQKKFNALYTGLAHKIKTARDTKTRVAETMLQIHEFQLYASLNSYEPMLLADSYSRWFGERHEASATPVAIEIYDELWRKALIDELQF